MTGAAALDHIEVLVFQVGEHRYAIPSAQVRELIRAVRIVPLPRAPAIVEGVINVRGEVIPVLDLRTRFRLPPKPLEPTDHFVLAWAGPRPVALRADRAVDLIRLDPRQVQDARAVVPNVEYVAGVAKLPDGLVLIHDLATFLSEAEAMTLDQALAPAGPS